MKETRYYKVAGHRFCVTGEAEGFANYEPFLCEEGETVFALTIGDGEAPEYTEELRQEDEGRDGSSALPTITKAGSSPRAGM